MVGRAAIAEAALLGYVGLVAASVQAGQAALHRQLGEAQPGPAGPLQTPWGTGRAIRRSGSPRCRGASRIAYQNTSPKQPEEAGW